MKRSSSIRAFKKRISNISLRARIMLLYVAMILFLIPVMNILADKMIFKAFKSDYSVTVLEAAKQTAKDIEFRKKIYQNALLQISFDGVLNTRLSQHNTNYQQCWDTVNYIYNSLGFIKDYLPGVVDFRIYHTNKSFTQDAVILWEPDERHQIAGMNSNVWFNQINQSSSNLRWRLFYNPDIAQYMLSLTCKLTGLVAPVQGCLYLAMKDNEIFNNLSEESASKQNEYYLVSSDGTIFSATKSQLVGTKIQTTGYGGIFRSSNAAQSVKINGIDKIVAKQQLSDDWQVIVAYSVAQLQDKINKTKRYFIIIVSVGILLLGVLLLMILGNMFGRLTQIGEHMSLIMNGEFDIKIKKDIPDEISFLENRFNQMSSRLQALMDEIVASKIVEREQALKVLESKINPHFLYNTLGLIRWEALDADNQKLCSLVDSMAVFYRISLNKGNTTLKIRDELELVKAYLSIQQISYEGIVEIQWDVDEDTLDFYTIKLLLQPIVENCYKHGRITKEGNRRIMIRVKHQGDNILLGVEDNGAGISSDKLAALFDTAEIKGIGLSYIRDMLQVYFKDRGKISIESEPGKGTSVMIIIPACSQDLKIGGQ